MCSGDRGLSDTLNLDFWNSIKNMNVVKAMSYKFKGEYRTGKELLERHLTFTDFHAVLFMIK